MTKSKEVPASLCDGSKYNFLSFQTRGAIHFKGNYNIFGFATAFDTGIYTELQIEYGRFQETTEY